MNCYKRNRKGVKEAADPEATRAEKIEEYRLQFSNPYIAAARGYVDAVIAPRETRRALSGRWTP